METTSRNTYVTEDRNAHMNATLIHLSGFIKFIFPLFFFIAPILIWSKHKDNHFVDQHGSEAINFHLSMFIYSLVIGFLSIILLILFAVDFNSFISAVEAMGDNFTVSGLQGWPTWILWLFLILVMALGKFIFEFVVMIIAALRASNGQGYHYPLTISFLKPRE